MTAMPRYPSRSPANSQNRPIPKSAVPPALRKSHSAYIPPPAPDNADEVDPDDSSDLRAPVDPPQAEIEPVEVMAEMKETFDGPDELRDRKFRFLVAFAKSRSQGRACHAVAITRRQLTMWREQDRGFSEMFDEVWENLVDDLEGGMMGRAINGVDEPVFHEGAICGYKRRYDTILALFMLKKNRPNKYEDKIQIDVSADQYAAQVRQALALQDQAAEEALRAADGTQVIPAKDTNVKRLPPKGTR